MKKILLLGPFPIGNKGLNGQTIANKTLYEGLTPLYDIEKINTLKSLEFTDKKDQGKFKIGKFLIIVLTLISEIFHILSTKYDVIYMTPGQSFLGFMRFSPYMFCSFIKKVPCYIHIHGGNFRKMYNKQSTFNKKLLNFFIKRMTGVIVLGESLKNMFEGLIENTKIFVCENGVQDEIIASEEEIEQKIERIKNSSKRKVLYLSNLMKEKGILELLKASEELLEEEFEFNLAGAIEPSIKETIEEYLKKYPNKIYYHGVVSGKEKKKLFLDNDIFILPSWDEGQPISILEAYATGCSVITDPNVGGIKDIFKDNENGKKCKIKNIISIRNTIKQIKNDKNYMIHNYQILKKFYTSYNFIIRVELIIRRNLNEKNKENNTFNKCHDTI